MGPDRDELGLRTTSPVLGECRRTGERADPSRACVPDGRGEDLEVAAREYDAAILVWQLDG
jgi:hypothetical protein